MTATNLCANRYEIGRSGFDMSLSQRTLEGQLVCPTCRKSYPPPRRTCPECWMPLVDAAELRPARRGVARLFSRRGLFLLGLIAVVLLWVGLQVGQEIWQENRPVAPPSTALSGEAGPGAWTMDRRDPLRSGDDPSASPLRGQLAWTADIGGWLGTSPVVADGVIYLSDGGPGLIALAAEDGHRLWQAAIDGAVVRGPAVAGDQIYVGNWSGQVVALDRRGGDERWKRAVDGPVASAPLVAGGLVYVGTRGGDVYALDAADGAIRWTTGIGAPATGSPILAGDRVYVGTEEGGLVGVDARRGAVRYEYRTGRNSVAVPASDGNLVYVGGDGRALHAVSIGAAGNGELFWTLRTVLGSLWLLGLPVPEPPTPAGFRWVTPVDAAINSAPVVGDGRVFVTTDRGSVFALDSARGALRWRRAFGGSFRAAPALGGDVLYVAHDRAGLFALNAATGETIWNQPVAGVPISAVTLAADRLYFGTDTGKLYAVR
jgi:outer membrane protein assembly factor BamB